MAEVQIHSVSHRHEAMADWLLANPTIRNLQEMANHFGYSRSWLSIVMNSDVWKEYWHERRTNYVATLEDGIQRAQMDVALKALQKLPFIIEDEETDPRLVFDIANKTVAQLYPSQGKRTTVVEEKTQEVTRVGADVLANARETLRRTIRTEYAIAGPIETTPS